MSAPEAGAFERPSGRVVLLDPANRVLLFTVSEPDSETGLPIWFTPGGGLEAGESPEAGALRELLEETGLDGISLGPCVWIEDHTWQFQGRAVHSTNHYFVAHTTTTDVSAAGRTELEIQLELRHRWWSIEEMGAGTELFAPRDMPELLRPLLRGELPARPIVVRR